MNNESELKLKKQAKADPSAVFVIAAALLIFSPFASMNHLSGWVLDCSIQIKLGLDAITSGHFITDEIYSWHEGLVFTAHETGWYLILGLVYKFFKLYGVLAVSTLFTFGTALTIANYIRKTAHPLMCLAVMVLGCVFKGFPDYNARPSTASTFIIIFTIVTLMSEKKPLFKAITFAAGAFLLAWLHGGMLPLYFAILAVFIVIELIFKQWRTAVTLLIGAAAGFIISIANPIGIRLWTYALSQSGAKGVWALIDEWNPVTFTIIQIFLILLVFVGFMCSKDIMEFKKDALTKLALLCMFLVISCVYRRFMLHFSLMFMLFAPKAYQDVISWLISHLLPKLSGKKAELSRAFYLLLAGVCTGMFLMAGILNIRTYLPTGTMADIEKMAAYDDNVVTFERRKAIRSCTTISTAVRGSFSRT